MFLPNDQRDERDFCLFRTILEKQYVINFHLHKLSGMGYLLQKAYSLLSMKTQVISIFVI